MPPPITKMSWMTWPSTLPSEVSQCSKLAVISFVCTLETNTGECQTKISESSQLPRNTWRNLARSREFIGATAREFSMAPRAIWKGHLSIDELSCAVALYSAATTSERVSFHMVNKKTGNRVRREYVDEQSGKPVPREDQVKGYETAKNNYIILEPEEIAEATPQGDKTLSIESFIPCNEVDTTYFDKPYFLTPADQESVDAFALIREGMRTKKA